VVLSFCSTQRERNGKTSSIKTSIKRPKGFPKIVREGSAKVTIYWQANRIRRRDSAVGEWVQTGTVHDEYVVAYYSGSQGQTSPSDGVRGRARLVREKFADLQKAEARARSIVSKLANLQGDALRMTNREALEYAEAIRELKAFNPEVKLLSAVSDFVSAAKRLPKSATLRECVEFYNLKNPTGTHKETVRKAVDELVLAKTNAGVSPVYSKELRLRLGQFADAFQVPITTVTSQDIQSWLIKRGVSGRTQNNYRRLISTLFNFAIRRGYLPRGHDVIYGVEKVRDSGGEIEIFTPAELRKLFAACLTQVEERGKWRDRCEMIPYLAIAAFCGLRSAEIARLDWSEVHLTGAERFIEVKASKAKTASRRTVPISDNCAAWLSRYPKPSGRVCPFDRPDKQCFQYLGPTANVVWKHNGLRHSFISYRLAIIKNVHQVSLEAGNSPQMVFRHYRQLVTETHANEWFSITPAQQAAVVPAFEPARNEVTSVSELDVGAAC
jgi:integrase